MRLLPKLLFICMLQREPPAPRLATKAAFPVRLPGWRSASMVPDGKSYAGFAGISTWVELVLSNVSALVPNIAGPVAHVALFSKVRSTPEVGVLLTEAVPEPSSALYQAMSPGAEVLTVL